ncbi:hypothetical protein FRC02_007486 [Tulasnella sp. 418]|nr:hypothetical protein FRC02_007486 [Tulasnella sp. 418]
MLQERYGSNPSHNESRPLPLSSLKLDVRKTNSDKVSDSEWLEHVGEDHFEMMKEKRTKVIDHRRAPLEGSELIEQRYSREHEMISHGLHVAFAELELLKGNVEA